ncbi:bleomycin resistance family protein [Clavibacter michiganensis]|uniref:bleomycin resistance protein n=1 Tax=Clavibacter michiganensis TaxID=28447 RepID=UPI000CE905A3|nr:VOC family protein [Clavibacter michiganensis]PPF52811.1 bleomycin resistance family protein [Clavibacter michiganensis]
MDAHAEPDLVPELLVTDLAASLAFWRDLCGFAVVYDRPAEGFAYIARGGAHLMLEQSGIIRNWVTGPLERPFGRGINLQVAVEDADVVAEALTAAGVVLYLEPETTWYRIGDEEAGVRQLLVQDPDGYLVRFQSSIGQRPAQEPDAD